MKSLAQPTTKSACPPTATEAHNSLRQPTHNNTAQQHSTTTQIEDRSVIASASAASQAQSPVAITAVDCHQKTRCQQRDPMIENPTPVFRT